MALIPHFQYQIKTDAPVVASPTGVATDAIISVTTFDIIDKRYVIYPAYQGPVPVPVQSIIPLDSWFVPFVDPKRVEKYGLKVASQPFFTIDPYALTQPETTQEDKWHSGWSEPVRFRIAPQEAIALMTSGATVDPVPIEFISDSKWHRPWEEPVRLKINPREAVALATSGLFFDPFVVPPPPEVVTEDKWHFGWSEPVRIRLGLRPANQLPSVMPPPEIILESKWHYPWSEPVRTRPGLRAAAQQIPSSWTFFPPDLGIMPWFMALNSPQSLEKRGLSARFQQFLARPPRVIQTPYITGLMNAIETGDDFLAALEIFNQVASANVGIIELIPGMSVPVLRPASAGIIEIAPIYANVGQPVQTTATQSGSAAVPTVAARVSIRTV